MGEYLQGGANSPSPENLTLHPFPFFIVPPISESDAKMLNLVEIQYSWGEKSLKIYVTAHSQGRTVKFAPPPARIPLPLLI